MSLQFNAKRHRYNLDGRLVPSCTQILIDCGMQDYTYYAPEYRERGRAAHELCAEIAALERPESPYEWDGTCGCGGGEACRHTVALPYAHSFKRWLPQYGFIVEPGMIEMTVFSRNLQCAGMLDLWGFRGSRATLIDLKTGDPNPGHMLQLAGYRLMLKECRGISTEQSFCLHLDRDGGFPRLVEPKDPKADERIFMSLCEVWYWRRAHGLLKQEK